MMKSDRVAFIFGLLLMLMFVISCEKPASETPQGGDPAAPSPEDVQTKSVEIDPSEPVTLAGSHILIAYKGASRAAETVTRTKEEALELAKKLAAEVVKNPDKLEELAKANSDCPSARGGGDLGVWQKGNMVPEFDEALSKLKEGEVTAEPVETSFGYHIMRRNALGVQEMVAAEHIFISHTESIRPNPNVTRSKDEAKTLADQVYEEAIKDPTKFLELASKYSDDSHHSFPGWKTGTGQMPKEFDAAVLSVNIGEVARPVETGFGFHIFHRTDIPPKFAGSHILIQFDGARMATKPAEGEKIRSKEEALKLAEKVLAEAKKSPEKFSDLAMKYSEDPSAKMNGGSLGVWQKGQMVKAFDDAIEKMQIGEISGPVESEFGYHIIMRGDPEKTSTIIPQMPAEPAQPEQPAQPAQPEQPEQPEQKAE